jgi:hypothetical protein
MRQNSGWRYSDALLFALNTLMSLIFFDAQDVTVWDERYWKTTIWRTERMSALCSLPNTAPSRQLCQLEPDQIEKVSHSALLKKFADFQTSQFRNWSRLAISAKSSPSGFDVSDCSNSLWRPLESNESQLGWQWLKHVETPLSPFQRTLLPGPTARPQGVWGTGHFETSLRCWAAFLSV